MKALLVGSVFCLGTLATALAKDGTLHTFIKTQLSDQFWGEGAHLGDFNRDGKGDVVSGPYWWEGPEFKVRHQFYPATKTFTRKKADGGQEQVAGFEGALGVNNAYSDNFFSFPYDFNSDGWPDVLVLGFPGDISAWYENPRGGSGMWKKHVILKTTDNESPTFVDITGDGKPEIVCNSGGYFGYAEPDWKDATRPWAFHAITPKGSWQRFTHGLGVGDVNGDKRLDVLEKDGWWEQPRSLAGDPVWVFHAVSFSPGGGAQMFAYDVDGDGDNDIITSLAAHGYGLAWYEQEKVNGAVTFKPHVFMNKEAGENRYGVHFSQLHALDLADIDGDGLKDIVTGKRFWAHGPKGDAEPGAPAVLYWFRLVRNRDKSVEFVPHLIDDDSGVGTQVVVGDVNGDKRPDIVVGNKKGTFIFTHQTKRVGRVEWEKVQPKLLGK